MCRYEYLRREGNFERSSGLQMGVDTIEVREDFMQAFSIVNMYNTWVSRFCCVCHLYLPLVSIFGLFLVLVSCHYELSMFQLCLSRYVLITLCILVLSFEFDFVWSTRYFLVYPVSLSCLVLP